MLLLLLGAPGSRAGPDYFDCDYFDDTYFDTPDCNPVAPTTGGRLPHVRKPARVLYRRGHVILAELDDDEAMFILEVLDG